MTEDPGTELPTFCHISGFGEYGYRRLHRMVAISQPLNSLVAGGFTGIQWPYLYTYGKSATRRRRTKMLDLLENID